MVDLEETSLSNEAGDREYFFDDALTDLGDSPWAQVVARAAPSEATAAGSGTPAASPGSSANKATTPEPEASPPSPKRRRFPGLPPGSPLAEIELGMSHEDVRRILGDPDDRINRLTAKAWIPFYTGPGVYLRDWIYEGEGRVVFSLDDGSLEVLDVVYDPDEGK